MTADSHLVLGFIPKNFRKFSAKIIWCVRRNFVILYYQNKDEKYITNKKSESYGKSRVRNPQRVSVRESHQNLSDEIYNASKEVKGEFLDPVGGT